MAATTEAETLIGPTLSTAIEPTEHKNRSWSTPRWTDVDGGQLVKYFVFDNGQQIFGADSSTSLIWSLPVRDRLQGWLVTGNNLYVVDGAVLLKYDLSNLQPDATGDMRDADAAYNFDSLIFWSERGGDSSTESLEKLYSKFPNFTEVGAPTLLLLDDPTVLILGNRNHDVASVCVFQLPSSLDADPSKQFFSHSDLAVTNDSFTLPLFLSTSASGSCIGQYLTEDSKGLMNVATLDWDRSTSRFASTGTLTPLPDSLRWQTVKTFESLRKQYQQGSMRLQTADVALMGFNISQSFAASFTVIQGSDVKDGKWFNWLLLIDENPPAGSAQILLIQEGVDEKGVNEYTGWHADTAGPITPITNTAPVVLWQDGTPRLYCLIGGSDDPHFAQYKLTSRAPESSLSNYWSEYRTGLSDPVPLLCVWQALTVWLAFHEQWANGKNVTERLPIEAWEQPAPFYPYSNQEPEVQHSLDQVCCIAVRRALGGGASIGPIWSRPDFAGSPRGILFHGALALGQSVLSIESISGVTNIEESLKVILNRPSFEDGISEDHEFLPLG